MLLSCENIYKYFSGEPVLKDVSFTIEDRDVIGIVGRNGCGKSTLLNIIAKRLDFDKTPDGKGELDIKNDIRIGYLEQNSGLESENTVMSEMKKPFKKLYDALGRMKELEGLMASGESGLQKEYAELSSYYEANDGYIIDVKIKTVLNGMGFSQLDPARAVSTLSGGEKTRLAMAKLLLEEPDLLILDEPTNHLDLETVSWLEDYLKGYKNAVVIVSHDRYFLDKLCSRIFEIEHGRLTAYKGGYTAYLSQKELNDEALLKQYEKQKREIAKLEDYIAKNKVRASTANMAKSRQNRLDRIERIEKPLSYQKPPKIKLEYDIVPPKDILKVDGCDLTVGGGDDSKTLIDSFDLEVKRGQKLSLIGKNGIGKTSVLKLIQNMIPHTKGKIEWADNVKTAYFEQEHSSLDPENTVIGEIHDRFPQMTEEQLRKVLGSVLISGEDVFKRVGVISGGERAKLCFAILSLTRANVLILDEPTNHLDLTTKEVLEKALGEFDGTIILVSHDRYLINKISTQVALVSNDGIEIFNGGYDDYLLAKKEREAGLSHKPDENAEERKVKKQYRTKAERSESARKRLRLKELEEEISELESLIKQLEADMADPEIASDYGVLSEKCRDFDAAKERYDKAMDEWYELAE